MNVLTYQWVLVGVTSSITVMTTLLLAAIFKCKEHKIMRASSPGLLYIIVLGCLVLHCEAILTSLPLTTTTCITIPWLHHTSFVVIYGALLLKTWRISVILRVFKARILPTKNSQLLWRLSMGIVAALLYLTIWTAIDHSQLISNPTASTTNESHYNSNAVAPLGCTFIWPDILALSVEAMLLVWGGVVCYQARKAPDMYNETRQISFTLWNQTLWLMFYCFGRIVLHIHPDAVMFSVLHFLYVHSTVIVMLAFLLLPKFTAILRKSRELHGTLSDVYGPQRIHRLSLVVNKKGEVRTIYCQPCGPLYLGKDEEVPQEECSYERENHYTKEEVDKLIEMVTQLKTERNHFSLHVQRLLHLLHANSIQIPEDMSFGDNATRPMTPPKHFADKSCDNSSVLECDIASPSKKVRQSVFNKDSSPLHMRKPSTITTYMSSVSEYGYGSLTTGVTSPKHLPAKISPSHACDLKSKSTSYVLNGTSGGLIKLPDKTAQGINGYHTNTGANCSSQPLQISSLLSTKVNTQQHSKEIKLDWQKSTQMASLKKQSNLEFPQILNSTDTLNAPTRLSNDPCYQDLELAHIEARRYSPNCYRKKIFLHHASNDGSYDKANFILFI